MTKDYTVVEIKTRIHEARINAIKKQCVVRLTFGNQVFSVKRTWLDTTDTGHCRLHGGSPRNPRRARYLTLEKYLTMKDRVKGALELE